MSPADSSVNLKKVDMDKLGMSLMRWVAGVAAGFGVLYGIGSKFFVTREEFQPVQTELKVMSEKIGQIRESVQDTKDGQKELASKMDKILTSVENR